jgi:hypothetical protein
MTYQKINRALLGTLLVAGMMGVASQAHALDVSPETIPVWYYLENANLKIADLEELVNSPVSLGLVYKQDFGNGEGGNAAGYYSTSFSFEPNTNDPVGATISWDMGGIGIACPTCYVVVKDGNHTPNQYIFTLDNWNGMDSLEFGGFWPGPGSISHIAIYNNAASGGGTIAAIPEPETYVMLLAGLGLVGFAARRKLS